MRAGAGNVHALAAARRRMEDEVSRGPCTAHPDRASVGFIDGWDRPRGCCEACARFGERHGYIVHRSAPPTDRRADG